MNPLSLSTWLCRVADREDSEYVQLLANTAGIVRGCLANLGIQASVVGECSNLPQGTSNARLHRFRSSRNERTN